MSNSQATSTFEDRMISSLVFEGLDRVTEQRILNLVRTAVGQPYDAKQVADDVRTLTHLGEFKYISADVVLQEDGTIRLFFTFREQQIITQVSVVGNTLLGDKQLLSVVPVVPGLGRDEDAIDRGRRAIMKMYQEQGNYLVEVFSEIQEYGKDVDEFTGERIDESIVLIYNIMEGPRVRVNGISFFGNHSFANKELLAEIDTRTLIPFLRRGELNEEMIEQDVSSLHRFYVNRGFQEVRVSFTDPLSPNDKEASVVFVIEEGPQYTLGGIAAEFQTANGFPPVFTVEQLRGLIPMKEGDVFRQMDVGAAIQAINKAYGVLGRIVNVDPRQQAVTRARKTMYGGKSSIEQEVVNAVPFHAEPGVTIDIVFMIEEGAPTTVGLVEIKGNTITKDKVIRGRLGLKPGYPFDIQEAIRSEDRLKRTQLFRKVTPTIQPKNSDTPGVRDLLVEVDERQTGSVNFGVLAGSDSGLMGNISLTQSNFDVTDWPESWSEFWQRKAFVGAGQQFSMAFQPGDKVFNYEISLSDPRFLDTEYSVGGRAGYNRRQYTDYTQETVFSKVSVGRRFGDIWYANVFMSADKIKLTDIDNNVPVEIFNDRGPSTVDAVGISVTRNTFKPSVAPTSGSRFNFKVQQFGIPAGDYDFTKTEFKYTTYLAMDRDFLNRVSTLRLDARFGYIFNGVSSTYNRFYQGGRNFRGFDYRTISPKGTPRVVGGDPDVSIGGDWEIFLGAQYEFPIVDRFLSAVVFCDSGTVSENPGFDNYRVSVGAGIRMHIPALGQAPLAFDFGFPVVKQESDKKRAFSFSVQLPF
ncbi:MAG: BamA/TamA family outer membrane protein [Phycisphaerae bacterium]|nr:BamA/TamA family outer membrane protein [Phycisphaerae bacterium]